MWLRCCARPRKGAARRGHALLETALLLGVMVPLAVVGARYGWSLYQVRGLHSAVEEAARYGASASLRDGEEAWRERVRNVAVCGKPESCRGARVPGLAGRHVRVELERAGASAAVRVSLTGFAVDYPGGVSRFEGRPSAQFPRIDGLASLPSGGAR